MAGGSTRTRSCAGSKPGTAVGYREGRELVSSQDIPADRPREEVSGVMAEPPSFDMTQAHPARVYDYWLGGKDHYEADREAAEQVAAALPTIRATVQANRAFLSRAVQYLAGEAGIRQFLDIGTGLPTADNTHEVAQSIAPESRIVYVDNDPIVLAHARALLTSTPEGATRYIDADLRDTPAILRQAAEVLDFRQPVAVMVLAVMQYVPDSSRPHEIISQLVDAVPPGSYLAMSDSTRDLDPDRVAEGAARLNARLGSTQITPRTRDEFARFFNGLDLVHPGLVPLPQWRALASSSHRISAYAAIGRKT
jgi:O-methyltransferase involved in polyketide biosynthesis